MQSTLKINSKEINIGWSDEVYKSDIPENCKPAFYRYLNKLIAYYKDLIDEMIESAGGTIKAPMSIEILEEFLSGFKISYIGFDENNEYKEIDGYFDICGENDELLHIFYNVSRSRSKQRFTIILFIIQWVIITNLVNVV